MCITNVYTHIALCKKAVYENIDQAIVAVDFNNITKLSECMMNTVTCLYNAKQKTKHNGTCPGSNIISE